MRDRLIVTMLIVAVLAGGCGGGPSQRDEVARYIARVNVIQAGLVRTAATVVRASRDIGKTDANQTEVAARLGRAAGTIDGVRRRVAAVTVPVEARKLRSLLLELTRRQAALARELASVASFLPVFEAALRPLAAAGTKLKAEVAVKSPVETKAAAFDAYAATIAAALKRLRSLHPPAPAQPGYTSEVTALTHARSAAAGIASALRAKQSQRIAKLLRRFDEAALGTQSLAAQRARIRALRDYNARVRSLDALASRITSERTRLQKTVR